MEPITIPPSPNWYETKIAICAPDNTLIYGANSSIVIIKPAPWDKSSEISVISYAHLDRVHCLAMAPTWNDQNKMIASIADDKVVKVWNLLDNTCAYSHKAHTTSKTRPVGVAFINDTKLVSVSVDGLIVVWKMTTNEFTPHKNLLGLKPHVTAISTCPHAGWLTAFGMRNGLVIVADLKGMGSVLYKLRSHEREVVDFAWCPKPTNVIPDLIIKRSNSEEHAHKHELEQHTPKVEEPASVVDTQDAQDTIDAMPANGTHLQCALNSSHTGPSKLEEALQTQEIGAITSQDIAEAPENPSLPDNDTTPSEKTQTPDKKDSPQKQTSEKQSDKRLENPLEKVKGKPKKKNPWANLKHADDDELPPEEPPTPTADTSSDFLAECLALKAKIVETKDDKDEDTSFDENNPDIKQEETNTEEPRKILHAVRSEKKPEKEPVMNITESADIVSDCLNETETSAETSPEVIDAQETDTQETEEAGKIEEPEKTEFLLASSARGGHIVIWRAGTDGRVHRRMRIPKPKTRGTYSTRAHYNLWLSLHWISPEKLLSSGMNGDLILWNVCDQSPKPKLIHNDHPKQLFCITSRFAHERETYSPMDHLAAWTIGQDRSILYTMLQSRSVLVCYPALACSVMTSASSPIAPTRIAFGLADGFIRIWDLSKDNHQYIQMSQIKQKIGGKVLSLAWHTSQEYLLAFGTEDGQIGYVNSGQGQKAPTYFAQHFLTAIHKLEWAPIPGKSKDVGLYCVAGGQLAIYSLDRPVENPDIVKTPLGERITNFAWKPDYTRLALGCKNGTIFILDQNYDVQTTLYYQKKGIITMAWHPLQTAEDEEKSPNHEWLATAASGDNIVVIFDLSKVSDELCMKEVIAGELVGHVKHINHIFWSPYKNGVVATASEDGTVTVWSGMLPISTFLNNNVEPLYSGLWSPLSEDVIISTGKDCSVRVWNLRQHPTKEQSDMDKTRLVRKKNLGHYRSQKEELELEVSKSKRYPLLSEINARHATLECASDDCRVLFEHLNKKCLSEDNLIVRLHGDPSGMSEIIESQKEVHGTKLKGALANHLQLWTGDIGETIKKAIAGGCLTPWLISVAPMISFSLWQEAVEAYAGQLAESTTSDPAEIAACWLTLHRVDEAIDAFATKQMHREALVLAKLKKPDDTALHQQILLQWARASVQCGRFECAAQSYIALGQYEEAAKVLYKRTELASLALAVELAQHVGNEALATTIRYRYDVLRAQEAVRSNGGGDGSGDTLVHLATRAELEIARARVANGGSGGGDGDDIDKNADRRNNGDANGTPPSEADNKLIDAGDNHAEDGADSGALSKEVDDVN